MVRVTDGLGFAVVVLVVVGVGSSLSLTCPGGICGGWGWRDRSGSTKSILCGGWELLRGSSGGDGEDSPQRFANDDFQLKVRARRFQS